MQHEVQLNDGSSVIIRPYRREDAEPLYEAVRESIRELMPWMAWCHQGYSMEESRSWVETRPETWTQGLEYDFALIDATHGKLLGGCGLNGFNQANRFANLGYWVRSRRTRSGLATAATRYIAAFGFTELALTRIEIVVATGNMPSQRVAEKVGATQEGILRNRLVVRDHVHDAVMFSLIPKEFMHRNSDL